MRVLMNLAIASCLFGLVGVNLAFNPFAPQAFAESEVPCEGEPPCEGCECCAECSCWQCDCDGDGVVDY